VATNKQLPFDYNQQHPSGNPGSTDVWRNALSEAKLAGWLLQTVHLHTHSAAQILRVIIFVKTGRRGLALTIPYSEGLEFGSSPLLFTVTAVLLRPSTVLDHDTSYGHCPHLNIHTKTVNTETRAIAVENVVSIEGAGVALSVQRLDFGLSGVRFPPWAIDFSLLKDVQTYSGIHPASCSIRTGTLSRG
jgi:hypothetical protein